MSIRVKDVPLRELVETVAHAVGLECEISANGIVALAPKGDQAAGQPLERRWEEDELSETLYQDVPFPERQLLALAHSLIKRGLVDEAALVSRMKQVHERLNAV